MLLLLVVAFCWTLISLGVVALCVMAARGDTEAPEPGASEAARPAPLRRLARR